jgi:hypothetical protein
MLAVTELVDHLDVVGRLDGPIKQRRRGHTAGEVLVGTPAAQLTGEDFWSGWTVVGLDRRRGDLAGRQLAPVPGLAATTAAGLARKFGLAQWRRWRPGSGTSPRRRWPRCLPSVPRCCART